MPPCFALAFASLRERPRTLYLADSRIGKLAFPDLTMVTGQPDFCRAATNGSRHGPAVAKVVAELEYYAVEQDEGESLL